MLHQELIPIDNTSRWCEVLAQMQHAPAHTVFYNQAMMLTATRPCFLYYAEGKDFVAACPVSVRSKFETKDLVTPYGFGGFIAQGEHHGFALQFDEFMRANNILSSYLAVHPSFCESQTVLELSETTDSAVFLLDLQQQLSIIHANLHKTHRYELRQQADVQVELLQDSKEYFPDLLDLYRTTLQRTGASSVYHFTDVTLAHLIDNKQTLVFAVKADHKIVAIIVIIYNEQMADYFINAASDIGRQYARALLWRAIEYLHHLQVPTFNLGGGVRPGDSLEQFKRRFAGRSVNSRALKRIYDNNLYEDICQRVNIDDKTTQYFPAYHAV